MKKNKIPDKWWNKGINPIVGFRIPPENKESLTHKSYELIGTTRSHV